MEIKLQHLTIQNFKGITEFVLSPNGKSQNIYAENRVGKTTLFDAVLWLFFGKNSEGKSDFGIRPVDENNQRIKGLVTVVEGVYSLGDETHTFRKELHEKIVKKQVTGFEAVCSIDEVPKLKGEYEAYIADIISEDVFKMLTDLQAFNTLHWSDRRKILLVLAGEIGTPKGFSKLLGKLNGRTLKDYQDVLKKRKKAHEKERLDINPSLAERNKVIEEIGGQDLQAAGDDRVKSVKAKTGFVEQKQVLIKNEAEREKKVDAINELKVERSTLENTLKQGDVGKTGPLLRQKVFLAQTVSDKSTDVSRAKLTLNQAIDSVKSHESHLQVKMERKDIVRDGYLELKKIEPDTICMFLPEGQECPLGHKAKMTADQKAIRLQEYIETGMGLKKEIEQFEAVKAKQEEHRSQSKVALETYEKELTELRASHDTGIVEINKKIEDCKAGVKPEDDDEWKRLTARITEAEAGIGPSVAVSMGVLDEQIQRCQTEIDTANSVLANKDTLKKTKLRIAELEAREIELAQLSADVDNELSQIDEYGVAESNLIEAAVNGMFKHTKFKLFDRRLNEGVKDTCEAMFDGTPYRDMSRGEKIIVGIDIRNVLAKHYGISPVLWIDNLESLTLPVETDAQVIGLVAEKGTKTLTVK